MEEERRRAAEAAKRQEETRKTYEDRLKQRNREDTRPGNTSQKSRRACAQRLLSSVLTVKATEDAPCPRKRKRQACLIEVTTDDKGIGSQRKHATRNARRQERLVCILTQDH